MLTTPPDGMTLEKHVCCPGQLVHMTEGCIDLGAESGPAHARAIATDMINAAAASAWGERSAADPWRGKGLKMQLFGPRSYCLQCSSRCSGYATCMYITARFNRAASAAKAGLYWALGFSSQVTCNAVSLPSSAGSRMLMHEQTACTDHGTERTLESS